MSRLGIAWICPRDGTTAPYLGTDHAVACPKCGGKMKRAKSISAPDAVSVAERDLGLILRNRNSQLVALARKHRDKETALLLICDAVTLAESKRIAREALAGDAE